MNTVGCWNQGCFPSPDHKVLESTLSRLRGAYIHRFRQSSIHRDRVQGSNQRVWH